ncbi:MAG: polysaccharide ABC transporter ATP-binding protein [Reichenbachiella sp.]
MSDVAIKIEGLSKQYRLGQVGTGTISHDLNRWWHQVRGKEDPYLKIGQSNDRTQIGGEYVWALQDINFEVKQGEVLGIIGKNGAGKSTLLKLLSKVTSPTTGKIKAKGRIASLLEVGTGFHPEMTGRENIFMNGTIMGMNRHEIASKLDEIVDFAGVAKYLDTPVKRYSSGMTVRLGFAIAAHLEPEILIVDEVLAVGDAEFQEKCLGKMKNVSQQGRTILFVSHNMSAIESLCPKSLWIDQGFLKSIDNSSKIIASYLSDNDAIKTWNDPANRPGNHLVQLTRVAIKKDIANIKVNDPFSILISFQLFHQEKLNLSLVLWDSKGVCVFNIVSDSKKLTSGNHQSCLSIPANLLNDETYFIDIYFVRNKHEVIYKTERCFSFVIEDIVRDSYWTGKWIGAVRPNLNFSLESI